MKHFLFLITSTILLHTTYAQPGTLDPTFAKEGKLLDTPSSYIDRVPMAVQQDGKILVGGYANIQNTTVFRVTRYLNDGL